jgi:hypothetical protein
MPGRRQVIEKLARVFDDKGLEVQASGDAVVTKLHAEIGQLVVGAGVSVSFDGRLQTNGVIANSRTK